MSDNTLLLSPHGPWEVPFEVNDRGAKHITKAHGVEFWKSHPSLQDSRGIYVFAIRNRALTPAYVGKASKTFGGEIFTVDKLNKYNSSVHNWPHGTPVLFLLAFPSTRWSNAKLLQIERAL